MRQALSVGADGDVAEPVAVLISVYGGDRLAWFAAAIESILKQDYPGEIRIYLGVDGPLAADVEEWVATQAEIFYRIVSNSMNIGLSKTLNRLLAVLENEVYIFRLDADDLCLPQRFLRQTDFLRTHPDVDMVGGAIWEYDATAAVAWKKNYPQTHDEICHYITRANPVAHSTVCFTRRFFERVGSYPDRCRYNQDLALWVVSLRRGARMANLEVPVVCLRTSPDFYTRRGMARAGSELRAYWTAIYYLHGFSWRLAVPVGRYLSRLLPAFLVRRLYQGAVRRWACRPVTQHTPTVNNDE
ncbi:MAG: glycosyltransferase [Desulfuromonadaceae bacterium]|nr:glycosyltransferase [Desulfuromonadaceae bacterium]